MKVVPKADAIFCSGVVDQDFQEEVSSTVDKKNNTFYSK